MKKNLMFAMFGAIALSGAVGLSSCTDEKIVDVNPTYDPESGEVTTNFVFNVSRGVSSTTRMTAANTQADLGQTFRGIENGYLMSVKLGTVNDGKVVSNVTNYSTTTTPQAGDPITTYNSKLFALGNVMTAGEFSQSETVGGITGTSRKIFELSLPTESNALLFWGKATKTSDSDHEQGKITMNIPENMNINDVYFKLNRVVPEDADEPSNPFRRSAFLQYESMMAAVLTKIIQSEANIGTEENPEYLGWVDYVEEVIVDSKTKLQQKEKDPGCPNVPQHNMSSLGEILADAYCTFNTIYQNELRAGCGSSIAHMINDLHAVVEKVTSTSASNEEQLNAIRVATAIKNNIETFFTVKPGVWKAPSTIKSNCGLSSSSLNLIDVSSTDATASGKNSIQNFPTFFHLPKGATILEFVKDTYTSDEAVAYNAGLTGAVSTTDIDPNTETYYTEEAAAAFNANLIGAVHEGEIKKKDARGNYIYKYQYMGSVPTYAMGGQATTGSSSNSSFDPRNYMFPPELCYFGNSAIRVSNDTHQASDYPDGPSIWSTDNSWTSGNIAGATGWTSPGHVLSTTRSVAMRDNINYGTALLQTTVKFATNKLQDNNHAIQERNNGANEENNIIDVSAGENLFKLTGILVGGQNPTVGWNYLPIIETGEGAQNYGAMVYDRLGNDGSRNIPIASGSEGGIATAPVYTLVWDNWEEINKDKDQRIVYLALEFENNSGTDFWGQNNLIRSGETFYLTAKLDPNDGIGGTAPGSGASPEEIASYYAAGITWPTDYALPPYDGDGNTIKQRRVFIQDHKTEANLKFTATSLQHALVAMPDLRSAQISLGLSVELNWRSGLTFDDIELGAQ